MGQNEILKRVGSVFYELRLSNEFVMIHPLFLVSMLIKCLGDPDSNLPLDCLGVKKVLSYEVPFHIFDYQVKRSRNKEVSSLKVQWRNHLVKGATWEDKSDM